MTGLADFLLLVVAALALSIVATSRLTSAVRLSALQGVALSLLPLALWGPVLDRHVLPVVLMSGGALAVKAVAIPLLLSRAIRQANVRREAEPFISQHVSLLIAAALVGFSFWLGRALVLPRPAPTPLLVPMAFATLLVGFVVLVSRRKAVTQVVGYLMLENGIFIFGQTLVEQVPFAVELGILLDLLVGVFVMGIAIHHISREFEHIDTERLSALRD
ncbi:MAG TPA: hydrogenase [Thermoanaerobaculia bacterium]|nr:hydrogenase [Thermoanaerobaculia bacterium]